MLILRAYRNASNNKTKPHKSNNKKQDSECLRLAMRAVVSVRTANYVSSKMFERVVNSGMYHFNEHPHFSEKKIQDTQVT